MRTTRTRGPAFVAVLAIAGALFAVAPAPADPVSCGVKQAFRWCDAHWAWDDLPVEVYANTSTLPSGVTAAEFAEAVRGAVDAWEVPAKLLPLVPDTEGCPSGTRIFCYRGTTSTGKAVDGKTIVAFGSVSGSSIGEARRCYVGPPCTATGTRIRDADVTLRSTGVPWHQASAVENAVGEFGGPFGPYRCGFLSCPSWYDVQSIITHELGHVLGLDEAEGLFEGCAGIGEWAGDLSDVVNYVQTMYPCQWTGLTNRRTIDVGDFAGLAVVLLGSWLD